MENDTEHEAHEEHAEQLVFPGMEDQTERQAGDLPPEPSGEEIPEDVKRKVEEFAAEHGYSGIEPASEEPEEEKPREDALTGFLVYVMPDGKAVATSNIDAALAALRFAREATTSDMLYASLQVIEDVRIMHSAQASAQAVINAQMQISQQLQQQAEAQQIARGLQLPGQPNRAQRRAR